MAAALEHRDTLRQFHFLSTHDRSPLPASGSWSAAELRQHSRSMVLAHRPRAQDAGHPAQRKARRVRRHHLRTWTGTNLRILPDSAHARFGHPGLMFGQQPISLSAPRAVRDAQRDARPQSPLSATLASEDAAEERELLSPHDRVTCPAHRRWAYQCASSPAHAIRVTGHRWCRQCDTPATIAIDELTGSITLTCPRCRRSPNSAANRQLLRSCRASIAAARQDRLHVHSAPAQRKAA